MVLYGSGARDEGTRARKTHMEIGRDRNLGRNNRHKVSCRNLAFAELSNPDLSLRQVLGVSFCWDLMVHLEVARDPRLRPGRGSRHQGLPTRGFVQNLTSSVLFCFF